MSHVEVPAELWTQIFDIAADEDVIFQYGLPTVMAECAWFKTVFNEWTLRTPQEALNLIQRRSYATKKAIISTCKLWRRVGSEFLFRSLFFDDPKKLQALAAIFSSSASTEGNATAPLGWWTKRIHLARYYASRDSTMSDMDEALISIIKHCPNLEIFIVDWPMPNNTFGPIADALATYASKSLRTVHWHLPAEALPKVIWALDSLPFILSAHIEFETPLSDSDTQEAQVINLGAAADLHLTLPHLQQLSLKGHFQDFLEQATGWSIPSLKNLTFDCGNTRTDQPDIIAFLTHHGAELLYLDLYSIPSLDVPKILDICPFLISFSFNADWHIPDPGQSVGDDADMNPATNSSTSTMVNRPHANITTIGLHGLMYAFGVGYAATYASISPLRSHMIRLTNDRNIAALTKLNFPKLKTVRALSQPLLMDLEKEDGPAQGDGGDGGLERWERWWGGFVEIGVRLEDCTGALLGTLPQDEGGEDEEDESDEDEGEWGFEIPPLPVEGGSQVEELRQLLEECRIMSEERDESSLMFFGGGPMAMGPFMGGGIGAR